MKCTHRDPRIEYFTRQNVVSMDSAFELPRQHHCTSIRLLRPVGATCGERRTRKKQGRQQSISGRAVLLRQLLSEPSVLLPVCLADARTTAGKEAAWCGENKVWLHTCNRVLFVCPREDCRLTTGGRFLELVVPGWDEQSAACISRSLARLLPLRACAARAHLGLPEWSASRCGALDPHGVHSHCLGSPEGACAFC